MKWKVVIDVVVWFLIGLLVAPLIGTDDALSNIVGYALVASLLVYAYFYIETMKENQK